MKTKGWLDYLYYKVGKQQTDFFLQYSRKDSIHTKWEKYSEVCFDFENPRNRWFLEHVNQRQILPNEVVLDLEDKNQLPPITQKLKAWGLVFYVFATSSRGYHINIFFDRELSESEKLSIISNFGADLQKSSNKTLIALEFAKHWKSGQTKELMKLIENGS